MGTQDALGLLASAGLWAVLLGVALVAYRLFYRRSMTSDLVRADNPAMAIHFGGHMAGVLLVALVACRGLSAREGALPFLVGVGFLLVASLCKRFLPVPRLLRGVDYLDAKKVAPALSSAGYRIGCALVFSGAMSGEGGSWATVAVYAALGLVVLPFTHALYWKLVRVSLQNELEADNTSVGLFSLGLWISAGLLFFESARGDFTGWPRDLGLFALHMVGGLVFAPLVFTLLVRLLFPGHSLETEMVRDRNWGFSFLSAFTLVAATFAYVKAFG